MALIDDAPEVGDISTMAHIWRQFFLAFKAAGFDDEQALYLVARQINAPLESVPKGAKDGE